MNDNVNKSNKIVTYRYRFIFGEGIEKEFEIKLNNRTLDLIQKKEEKIYPEWTKLDFFKCPNCSLNENQYKFCPIAISLIDLVGYFSSFTSYDEVDMVIETEARKYVKRTSLQRGLSSLIGIYMVTSGCLIMEKLKPMVRYHLPFATEEETRYRVISMYIVAQYFLFKRGETADWELKNLVNIYDDIQTVNKYFCKRLATIQREDASVNALIILNCFADFVRFSINKKMLDEIGFLFSAYFK